jgi:hypothetical protein
MLFVAVYLLPELLPELLELLELLLDLPEERELPPDER